MSDQLTLDQETDLVHQAFMDARETMLRMEFPTWDSLADAYFAGMRIVYHPIETEGTKIVQRYEFKYSDDDREELHGDQ